MPQNANTAHPVKAEQRGWIFSIIVGDGTKTKAWMGTMGTLDYLQLNSECLFNTLLQASFFPEGNTFPIKIETTSFVSSNTHFVFDLLPFPPTL